MKHSCGKESLVSSEGLPKCRMITIITTVAWVAEPSLLPLTCPCMCCSSHLEIDVLWAACWYESIFKNHWSLTQRNVRDFFQNEFQTATVSVSGSHEAERTALSMGPLPSLDATPQSRRGGAQWTSSLHPSLWTCLQGLLCFSALCPSPKFPGTPSLIQNLLPPLGGLWAVNRWAL